jgi:hypothetical protein
MLCVDTSLLFDFEQLLPQRYLGKVLKKVRQNDIKCNTIIPDNCYIVKRFLPIRFSIVTK